MDFVYYTKSMQFPCALGNRCAKKILLLPLSPKYARFIQVYGIIVKSKDLNTVNFSLLLWATVIERICAQMYYSPVSQFLANLLPGVDWTRYCGMDSGILPRHEFAIDSGGRHLLLTSKLNTAPLYQVSMPFSSHIFCPLYVDRLCWN